MPSYQIKKLHRKGEKIPIDFVRPFYERCIELSQHPNCKQIGKWKLIRQSRTSKGNLLFDFKRNDTLLNIFDFCRGDKSCMVFRNAPFFQNSMTSRYFYY